MRRRTCTDLGALCSLTLLVVACGGSPSKSPGAGVVRHNSTSTVAPASSSAALVTGSDRAFRTVVPQGFSHSTGAGPIGPGTNVVYLALGPRIGNFTVNINVFRERAPGPAGIDAIARAELGAVLRSAPDAHAFSSVRALSVGGSPARSVDYLTNIGRPLHLDQVLVAHGGWIYTITYTAPPAAYRAHVGALGAVTGAWRWG